MAISNTEKQNRFYASKIAAGESKISCWLSDDDSRRLRRLIEILSAKNNSKADYADVVALALAQLEQSLAPPKPQRRYGLVSLKGLSPKSVDNLVFNG